MALKRIWTEEDDRRLLELRQDGRTSISIAAKLKRTAEAVDARLSFLRRTTRGLSATSGARTAGTKMNPLNCFPHVHSLLHKQIVRQMVLGAFFVINGVLLRECKANQVCFLDRGQSVISGSVQAMFCRIRSVAHM